MLRQAWWPTPLISAHRRQRQEDLYEFTASLVYIVSSRQPRLLHSENLYKKKDHSLRENWAEGGEKKKERRKRWNDLL